MSQHAVIVGNFRSRVNAAARSVFFGTVLILVLTVVLSNQRLYAQSACAQLGVDCSHHGSQSTIPTTQQMIQQQVASSVVNAFVNMLFSNDSQANAQKQKMLAELQARQQAAERQKQYEEAMRLAAICQRLQGTLKLSGTPGLKLKSEVANSGLQLKLGDDSGHIGVPGLPGIALNDNTGNGGTTPYGIAGLPGIYTNGPATPTASTSGRDHSSTGGLSLKLGDNPSVGQTTQPTATPTTDAAQSAAIPDPRTMTPQQLADLAASLPPEQQQQLANALQTAQSQSTTATTASGQAVHLSANTTVSAAPEPITTAATVQQNTGSGAPNPTAQGQSNSTNSPALGQLQGTAAASQAAAQAKTPEDMAAGARVGFDQAAGGTATPVHLSGNSAPQTAQGNTQSTAGAASASAGTPTHSKPGATSSYPAVDMSVLKAPPPITTVPTGSHSLPNSKPQCVKRTEHKLPSRQELLTELAQRRTELENLRRTILRLNRSIQMDQKQFEMWQAEAEAGHERVVNRVFSLPTKLALDSLIELKEAQFATKEEKGLLTAADEKQMRMLDRAKDLKTFDDFQKWVLEEKSDDEMYEEGMRQLIAMLPFGPEVQSYANAAEDLIDNAYDLVDLVNTWDNVQQLDHNSDRFLLGVKGNGERMKSLVTRIRQIESQLNGTPQNVQIEYCSR